MEFNKKFNVLATIASLLLIVNFFFTDMSTTSILSAILSLVVVIGYAMYQNKNFYAKLEEKFEKLENSIDDIEKTYKMTRNSLETVSSKSEVEEDKVAEIDDALENTSTMVIRNKENTRQASQLTQAVITAIDNGNAEMQVMMGSVNEIKTLSGEIQKIIKVINDIAFQTNILALNAAVEAARAGDAGKGFAVVADEVRNLAQKSAEAVNSTTQIIESNLIAAENSVEISAKVEEALIRTSEEAKKVEELINEIAASSEEQATEVLRTKTLANGLDSIVKESNGAKDNNMQNIEKLSEKIFDLNELVKNFDAERDNEVELEKVNTPLNKSTKKVEEDKKVSTLNVESKIKKEDKTLNVKKSEIKVEPKIETKVESKVENIKRTDVKKDEKLEKEKVEDNMTFDDNKASKDSNEEKLDVKEEKFDKFAFEKAKEEINNKKAAGKRITRADAEMILPLDDTDGF